MLPARVGRPQPVAAIDTLTLCRHILIFFGGGARYSTLDSTAAGPADLSDISKIKQSCIAIAAKLQGKFLC